MFKIDKTKIKSFYTFATSYNIDTRNLILGFLFLVYPLFIFPNYINSIIIPRYYMFIIASILALFTLIIFKVNLKEKMNYALAAFLMVGIISSVLSQNKLTAFVGLAKLMAFPAKSGNESFLFIGNLYYYTGFITFVFCSILFLLASIAPDPIKLLSLLVVSTTIVSFTAILQFLGVDIVPWNDIGSGASGTMGNPNFMATLAVLVLPGSILLYFFNGRSFWYICSSITFGALLVSNTRGAWLTFVIITIIMYIYFRIMKVKLKVSRAVKIILSFIIIMLLLFALNNGILLQRGSSIGSEIKNSVQLKDDGGSYRIYIWKEVMKIIEDNWAFGIGPDNLVYKKITLPEKAIVTKAHNNMLEIAVTMGIPAVVAYLGFTLSVFLRYRRGNHRQFIFLLMSLAFLIQGFANIDMIMTLPLFWIVLGLSVSCARQEADLIQKIK